MKVAVRGGVWKNTEDEVLKAAVMKYGKNNWARIASLLNRKTPKQCKARWYEWLDPSIKKTEWTKEEDEKLLHLAKLMPTQWRTIAPLVGRTSNQCLERYQRLLDEAELKERGVVEDAMTADDVRKLRPGEMDPNPETKPAKPDPIDMDEDEKEMLSEARARFANTQGKKAKRKARERQLAESRRLGAVQKRREMKAAGITTKLLRLRKGEVNLNEEIPFQVPVPAGFYDTQDERDYVSKKNFLNISLSELEKSKRGTQENEQDSKDTKNERNKKDKDGFAVPMAISKEEQAVKRRKLVLPAPSIGDNEVEELIKLGQTNKIALDAVGDSSSLVTDYSSGNLTSKLVEMRRTPMVHFQNEPLKSDVIHAEASNLLKMQQMQTPLLGGENQELSSGGTGFASATPKPIASTSKTPSDVKSKHKTPVSGFAGGKTPLRDDLNINEQRIGDMKTIGEEEEESDDEYDIEKLRKNVAVGLMNLPKPKNEFEIVDPESEEEEEQQDEMAVDVLVEDQTDVERRIKEERKEKKRKELSRRSQVIKRNLPRPKSVANIDELLHTCLHDYEKDVIAEMINLIKFDQFEYPFEGSIEPDGDFPELDTFTDEELQNARNLIIEEMLKNVEEDKFKDDLISHLEDFNKKNLLNYDITEENDEIKLKLGKKNVSSLKTLHQLKVKELSKISEKSVSLHKTVDASLKPLISKANELKKELLAAIDEYDKSKIELNQFSELLRVEKEVSIPHRISKAENELSKVSGNEIE
jgi:pre-mRNA-splicing factor CDC5/CEF1